jgi:CBS-domain-containing membrane protein
MVYHSIARQMSIFTDQSDFFGFGVGSYVAVILGFLGILTWALGDRFLLPSLGPSMFALATLPDEELHVPRKFIGGQFIGAVAAFIATEVLVGGLAVQGHVQPFSPYVLKQVAASFIAVFLTTVGMHITNLQHPPAYATTLIVSLGFLDSILTLGFFLLAVVLMAGFHEIVGKRLPIWNLPYETEREDMGEYSGKSEDGS